MTLFSLSLPCPQLQELLETGGTVQKLGPGPQAQAVQQRQRALVQAWEALKLHVEQRRAQLERAWLLARFHAAVRALPSPGSACVCVLYTISVHALMRPSNPGGKTSGDTRRKSTGHVQVSVWPGRGLSAGDAAVTPQVWVNTSPGE